MATLFAGLVLLLPFAGRSVWRASRVVADARDAITTDRFLEDLEAVRADPELRIPHPEWSTP